MINCLNLHSGAHFIEFQIFIVFLVCQYMKGMAEIPHSPKRAKFHPARVLTIGDGNLSYSAGLAKKQPHFAITATTYDSIEELKRKYSKIDETIQDIISSSDHAEILHGIDAMKADIHFNGRKFDKIIFMHPLVPAGETTEFVKSGTWKFNTILINRRMLLLFLKSALTLLADSNHSSSVEPTIEITMKNVYPYNWWQIDKLAQHVQGLRFIKAAPFDPVEGYESRNVERDKSFPVSESLTFIYGRDEERSVLRSVLLTTESKLGGGTADEVEGPTNESDFHSLIANNCAECGDSEIARSSATLAVDKVVASTDHDAAASMPTHSAEGADTNTKNIDRRQRIFKSEFYCSICGCHCATPLDLETHFASKKHKKFVTLESEWQRLLQEQNL